MQGPRKTPIDPAEAAQSTNLVRIVAVFYALVLGQALITKYNVVLHLGNRSFWVAGLTLLLVFLGAAWEYLRLSLNVERFPYDVKWIIGGANRTRWEEIRFGLDLLTAAGYAVLLIEAFNLKDHESANIGPVLATLLTVNGLSYVSTRLLPLSWDTKGRRKLLEGKFVRHATWLTWWPSVFLVGYILLEHQNGGFTRHRSGWNVVFLAAAVVALNVWELLERKAVKAVFKAPRDTDNNQVDRGDVEADTAKADPVSADAVPVQLARPTGEIYLAGPLGFSAAGLLYHETVLRPSVERAGWTVSDPWEVSPEDRAILQATVGSVERSGLAELSHRIGRENARKISECTTVLAVLDGSDVDSGTAAEIGYAARANKRIVGLRLDTRQTGDNETCKVNLQVEYFIVSSGGKITASLQDAITALGTPGGS